MSTTDAVPAEVTSTSEPMVKVDGAIADPETVVTEFIAKTWRDNLTLVVENRQLYVSKSVLALASPIFDEMITAECQEKDKGEITLPGKTLDDFVEFLKCIYPGKMKPVTVNNVFKVLPLAREYQIETLKNACEVCLLSFLSRTKNKKFVYLMLEQACMYGLDQAKKKCIDTVTERPHEEFDEAANTFTLSVDVQNEIRKRLFVALSIKYNNLCGHVKTSEALNRFLGDMASHRGVVTKYLGGRVNGDYVHLKVSSKHNFTAKMYINNLHFNLLVHKQNFLKGYLPDHFKVQINCKTKRTVNCLCAVVIHNWMQGKEDIKGEYKLQFGKQQDTEELKFADCRTELVEDESAGFMYGGTMDFYIYLFCMEE